MVGEFSGDRQSMLDSVPHTLVGGASSSFRAWRFEPVSPDAAQFRLVRSVRFFFAFFAIVGLAIIIAPFAFGAHFYDGLDSSDDPAWVVGLAWLQRVASIGFPAVVGLVFLVIGLRGVLSKTAFGMGTVTFDRRRGMAWKEGKSDLRSTKGDVTLTDGVRLRDVAAVQLCSGLTNLPEPGWRGDRDRTPYWTFEINLVLSSPPGQRANVVSHANGAALRNDAGQLAEFLGVPLVDHTSERPKEGFREVFRQFRQRKEERLRRP